MLCNPELDFWQLDQNIQDTLEKLDELINHVTMKDL
jgi:hypothetical protein